MSEIMSGAASTPKIAAFLLGLKTKGESVGELTALADTMLAHAVRIEVPGRTLDIVGTGGDRSHTVNISTMSALVIAGAGITVVKHGNRAASSSSGSADVLEALGHPARPPAGPRRGARHRGRASPSASRRCSTPRSGTPPQRARSWASGRPSTSSGRSPTPPSRGPPRSASPRRGWHRCWPGCSPDAAPARSCSAARTVSTRSPRPARPASGRSGTAASPSR